MVDLDPTTDLLAHFDAGLSLSLSPLPLSPSQAWLTHGFAQLFRFVPALQH